MHGLRNAGNKVRLLDEAPKNFRYAGKRNAFSNSYLNLAGEKERGISISC